MRAIKILLLLSFVTIFLVYWNYEWIPDDQIKDMRQFFKIFSAINQAKLAHVAKVEAFVRTDKLADLFLSPRIKKIKKLIAESEMLIAEGEKTLDAIELAQKKHDYKLAKEQSFELEVTIRKMKNKDLEANELYEELNDILEGGPEDDKKNPKMSV